MKDFRNLDEGELQKILAVTQAIADKHEAAFDTANLTADEPSLVEAEATAKRYAEARRNNRTTLTLCESAEDEDGNILDRLRRWRSVTNRK